MEPRPTRDPDILTVRGLASLLVMGERQVREGLIRGDIPGAKIGQSWRAYKPAVLARLSGKEDEEKESAAGRIPAARA